MIDDEDFMQLSVEDAICKMLKKSPQIAIGDIICIVPVEELAGPMTTRFGVIDAFYSRWIKKEMMFYLMLRSQFDPAKL